MTLTEKKTQEVKQKSKKSYLLYNQEKQTHTHIPSPHHHRNTYRNLSTASE